MGVWNSLPPCPPIPMLEMRHALEGVGAKYLIFWTLRADGFFRVSADYVVPDQKKALENARTSQTNFCSESRKYQLPLDGDGPVATAWKTGKPSHLADAPHEPTFRRADLAKADHISTIHFHPCNGGVLEYGTPAHTRLSGDMLNAAMKMRCDHSGAGYAIYWIAIGNNLVVAGDY